MAQPAISAPFKRTGRVTRCLSTNAASRLGFIGHTVDELRVDHEGIVDNRYRGFTRKACSRVPYVKRGTPIRNDRQVSLVAEEDLAEIAARLEIPKVDPAWLGANVVIGGIANFSFLPRGTRLLFDGGAIVTVTDQNAPCRLAGAAIAAAVQDRPELKLQFPAVAIGLRGLVAAVEHPGTIAPGAAMVARIPAQWLYTVRGI